MLLWLLFMDSKKWDFGLCMLTEHRFFIPRPASSFNLRFHKGHFKFMATRGRGEGKIKSSVGDSAKFVTF